MNNIAVRMALYVLSPVLVTLAGFLTGWGVGFNADTGILTIHLETAVTAIVSALGISGAIFAKWGVK
ncbi:hypothetical protein [Paracoccus aestuariivivens]|uniref:Uncharacterized protein n=1 Tax=Paracoccus aestuariivivens TaxID=1820333 RepID=A0A6L6J6G7_9RHOB|nr:hypothetical protein [Paracoccus aestuariivivens]MTH76299.1 hypothetical protein [Paracoccus aestuariivivens]